MSLKITRTLDVGYCIDIITRPEIAAVATEDKTTLAHLNIDVIRDYWVKFTDGDKELGVALFHPVFSKCLDAHIHVLPEFRKEYTKDIGLKLWEWVEDNLKDCTITTHTPVIYPNVRDFLLLNKFKDVGTIERAFLKNDKLVDVWLMQKRVK